jgi:putative restriction endonuclease
LQANDLFLFKLHHPYNYIVGGDFFVRFSLLPPSIAWQAFALKNGTNSFEELVHSQGSASAKGQRTSDGFVVLRDSIVKLTVAP